MPHFFADKSLRKDFVREANKVEITDLVEQIVDAVEEIACNSYSEISHGKTYISDDPTPREGFEPICKEWTETNHYTFCEILLDRIADAIGERKRTDSEPCNIENFDF